MHPTEAFNCRPPPRGKGTLTCLEFHRGRRVVPCRTQYVPNKLDDGVAVACLHENRGPVMPGCSCPFLWLPHIKITGSGAGTAARILPPSSESTRHWGWRCGTTISVCMYVYVAEPDLAWPVSSSPSFSPAICGAKRARTAETCTQRTRSSTNQDRLEARTSPRPEIACYPATNGVYTHALAVPSESRTKKTGAEVGGGVGEKDRRKGKNIPIHGPCPAI